MKPTLYTQDNVRVVGATGEFIYLTKVACEIPDYITVKNGVRSRVRVDPKLTISIKTETLIALFLPLAIAGGSWADILPLDFINIHAAPNTYTGAALVPFEITFENIAPLIKIPTMDMIAGGELNFDIPCLVGECYIMGKSVNREPSLRGI